MGSEATTNSYVRFSHFWLKNLTPEVFICGKYGETDGHANGHEGHAKQHANHDLLQFPSSSSSAAKLLRMRMRTGTSSRISHDITRNQSSFTLCPKRGVKITRGLRKK